MKVGLVSPLLMPAPATPEYIATLAQSAEDRGINRIWLADPHIVLFEEYSSRWPYSSRPGGRMAEAWDEPDSFQALAFLAAVTERCRLACFCVVPQRNPLYTAKDVTTIDHLSGGRFDFGIGIGWNREEFAAVGVQWSRRGDRTREYLEVMLTLWQDPVSSYEGQFYSLPSCRQDPKPIQRPHPPIIFGGESDHALRRVADLGQGWFPHNIAPAQVAECVSRLDELLAEQGRSRSEVEICVSPFTQPTTREALEAYAAAGADEIDAWVSIQSFEELEPKLDELTEKIIEPAWRL
jgi:probable F420-dependent oxidoreductase